MGDRFKADPSDVEAQQEIEEAARWKAVLENLEYAIEYTPELFGRVIMLYVPIEINGVSLKAFVSSGAQQTIMSPECAETCNIMQLLDRRFSGIARGVGTARALGRVHSALMKFQDLSLACSLTIVEGMDTDLLFGLDMLKAHQACIDLEKYVLRIRGREVKFIEEHELPEKRPTVELSQDQEPGSQSSGLESSNPPAPARRNQDLSPGQENTLGVPEDTTREVPIATPTVSDLVVPGIEPQAAAGLGRDKGDSNAAPRHFRPSANVAIAFSLFCAFFALIFFCIVSQLLNSFYFSSTVRLLYIHR